MIGERRAQRVIVDDQMRALGTAHQGRRARLRRKQRLIDNVDPAAGGVDNQRWLDGNGRATDPVLDTILAILRTAQLRIVQCRGADV
ncbi:hypothetical protein D3C86_2115820 [compost metagenome]